MNWDAWYQAFVARCLKQSINPVRFVVALSGGLDSTVLLHILTQFSDKPILAVHVNHQLQSASSFWAKHCEQICKDLQIEFVCESIKIMKKKGLSLEAIARDKRYQVLETYITDPNTLLLTAHHQTDQAETLLLQLCRGAGPKGLSGMPWVKAFSNGFLVRPLLEIKHKELVDYAKAQDLNWIDDPSNSDLSIDRNFMRRNVLPLLQSRWPNVLENIVRSAAHCADSDRLNRELARLDLSSSASIVEQIPQNPPAHAMHVPPSFSKGEINPLLPSEQEETKIPSLLEKEEGSILTPFEKGGRRMEIRRGDFLAHLDIGNYFKSLSTIRQANLLRYWLSELNWPMPSTIQLEQIIQTVCFAKSDGNPNFSLLPDRYQLRRYQNRLYALETPAWEGDPNWHVDWDLKKALKLPQNLGVIIAKPIQTPSKQILSLPKTNIAVTLRFYQPGERFWPQHRQGSHPVKKLCQEWQFAPWERSQLLFIYFQHQLIGIWHMLTSRYYACDSRVLPGQRVTNHWELSYQAD